MSRNRLFATAIVIISCCSFGAYAANETSTNNATDTEPKTVSKDVWFSSMAPMLPEIVCKGFSEDTAIKKRFEELKMTYEDCLKVIPDSANKCKNELSPAMPADLDQAASENWGKKYGECIGQDFAIKHLFSQQ